MTTFYLDPENGSDAADGLSFANRWKTIQNGATAARTAAGDTIRIIASPDPTNPGNATWTDNSGTVTWAAAHNKVIDDCETNWTAAANITAALNTTLQKQGSNCLQLTPASGFTTGLVAYRTLPVTLDLSAFEQVSLWVRYGALTTAGQLELKLCSDASGATPVNTLSLPAGTNGAWRVVVLDNAAALGSSIASIAIYATADPGTTAFYLDNIVACKAASSAQCITHRHVVGKNTGGEPEWYAIGAIGDDTVTIGGHNAAGPGSSLPAFRPYRGTTEAVPTYVLRGIVPNWTGTLGDINEAGTEALPITYSGGWNRTDMSTQSGASYLNGEHFIADALDRGTNAWTHVEKIGALNFTNVAVNGSWVGRVQLEQVVGCRRGPCQNNNPTGAILTTATYIHGADAFTPLATSTNYEYGGSFYCTRLHGSAIASNTGALILSGLGPHAVGQVRAGKIDNSGGFAVYFPGADVHNVSRVYVDTLANNVSGDLRIGGGYPSHLQFFGPDSPTYTLNVTNSVLYATGPTASGIYTSYWRVATATDQRHTASDVAWKLEPLNTNCHSLNPAKFVVATVAVNASALVTIKVWARRSNTGLTLGLLLPAGSYPGVGDSNLTATMSAAADTWEELTLTFTPTQAGVVEVLGFGYGGTTYSGWIDDMTITQA